MDPPTPTTVLVSRFDDLLDRGLRQVIDGDPSLEIVAHDVAHDRLGVVMRVHRPRVAILDADSLSSLAEVRHFSETYPGTRLVLVVSLVTTAECVQAMAFGASAFLGRDTQARDVLSAIHLASRGLQLIPRAARESAVRPPAGAHLLTQREAQVLPLLQEGRSNMQISLELQIGLETVRTHARNIYRKLGVASRRELAALPPPPLVGLDEPEALPPRRRAPLAHSNRLRRPGSLRQ